MRRKDRCASMSSLCERICQHFLDLARVLRVYAEIELGPTALSNNQLSSNAWVGL